MKRPIFDKYWDKNFNCINIPPALMINTMLNAIPENGTIPEELLEQKGEASYEFKLGIEQTNCVLNRRIGHSTDELDIEQTNWVLNRPIGY
jgi:hypothetical protein